MYHHTFATHIACWQVHFEPQEAAAFRVAAACSLDNGELLTVQVRVISTLKLSIRCTNSTWQFSLVQQSLTSMPAAQLVVLALPPRQRNPSTADDAARCVRMRVQVSGMAKFPFLSLETDCIDMGDVVVGQTVEAFVRFGNHSPVPGNFFLAAGPGSHDNTITVQPARCVRVCEWAWHRGMRPTL